MNLPGDDIVVVHRSDGSGTTYVWTDYLSKVSEEWKTKVGKSTSVNWPVGLGGKGNEGVAGLVKQTPNSIGYVELIYAIQNNMPYGLVRNSSGSFVKAEPGQRHAPRLRAPPRPCRMISVSPSPTRPARTAYPIASFTWLLVPAQIQDASKRKVIMDFLHWMLTDGQKYAEPLAYARLPKEVVAKEEKAIARDSNSMASTSSSTTAEGAGLAWRPRARSFAVCAAATRSPT